MRILVVEDEEKVAKALKEGLEGEDYEVVVSPTGEDAFFRICTDSFAVIVLDLMLPGRDGLQVLASIRERGLNTPVLLLTARDTLEDRVAGLNAGADDYLIKPFAFAELLARIRVLLRRGGVVEALHFSAGDLDMDLLTREVTRGGRILELTGREFELLELLLRHKGQIVMRDTMVKDIWKMPRGSTPMDNVIDVHMGRLRKKIDSGQGAKLIHTVRGVGYMLQNGEPLDSDPEPD